MEEELFKRHPHLLLNMINKGRKHRDNRDTSNKEAPIKLNEIIKKHITVAPGNETEKINILKEHVNFANNGIEIAENLLNETKPILQKYSQHLSRNEHSGKLKEVILTILIVKLNGNIEYLNSQKPNGITKQKFVDENGRTLRVIRDSSSITGYASSHFHLIMLEKNIKEKIELIESKLDKQTSCFIATIIYKDYNSNEVRILREFRDLVLYKSFLGRILIKIYYKSNRFLHAWIEKNETSKKALKKLIDFIIKRLTHDI